MFRFKSQKGMTMLELVVVITFLSIGLLGFGTTIANLLRITNNAFAQKQATMIANNRIETFLAFKANNPPDRWMAYINNMVSSDPTSMGNGFTRDTRVLVNPLTVDGNSFNLITLQVSVSGSILPNPMTFQTSFTFHD